ncbi:hypothetical protein D9615_008122 [Tricholomella constricta]|uniref:Uncharacterized protein n=1 Tax=Tricholomella constricta TaxID=117010 RepID=A0A8H5GVG3_9AGAR|nr:hypothetical protein D9615_008122 [Tricholomella constricta]
MSNSAPSSPNELRLEVKIYDRDQPGVICQIPNITRDPKFDRIRDRMTLGEILQADLVNQALRTALEKMVGGPLPDMPFFDKDRTIFVEPPYTLETLAHGLSSSSPTITAYYSSKYLVARQDKSGYDLGDIRQEQATHQAQRGERDPAMKKPKTTIDWAAKQYQQVDEELARWESEAELMGKLAQSQTDVMRLERMTYQLMSTMKEMKEIHASSEKEMKDKQARWEQEMRDNQTRSEQEVRDKLAQEMRDKLALSEQEVRDKLAQEMGDKLARSEQEVRDKLAREMRDKLARSEQEVRDKLARSEQEMRDNQTRSEQEVRDKLARSEKEMKDKQARWEQEMKDKEVRSEKEMEEIRGELKKSMEKHSALEDELAAVTEANQDVMAAVADRDSAALDRIRLRNLLHRAQTCLGLITGVATKQRDASMDWRHAFAQLNTPQLRRAHARTLLSGSKYSTHSAIRALLASPGALDLVTDIRSHIRRSGDLVAHEPIQHGQYQVTISRHHNEEEKSDLTVLLGVVISVEWYCQ